MTPALFQEALDKLDWGPQHMKANMPPLFRDKATVNRYRNGSLMVPHDVAYVVTNAMDAIGWLLIDNEWTKKEIGK